MRARDSHLRSDLCESLFQPVKDKLIQDMSLPYAQPAREKPAISDRQRASLARPCRRFPACFQRFFDVFGIEMVAEKICHLVAVFDVLPTGKLHAVGFSNLFAHLNAQQTVMCNSVVFVSEVTVVGGAQLNVQLAGKPHQMLLTLRSSGVP